MKTDFATNTQVDETVRVCLSVNPNGLASMSIGSWLKQNLRLKPAGTKQLSELHNACEHANRACQRLRKAGKIQLHQQKWFLAP